MSRSTEEVKPGEMEIWIWLDEQRPPQGHLRRVEPVGQPLRPPEAPHDVPFSGWLSLLRALQDLIDPAARPRRP
jgi:hypothetical protein